MISNVLDIEQAIKVSNQLKNKRKSIVLVGGCFDILHVGHVRFLQSARKQGDVLFVLLESDENVRKLKGKNRPINSQIDRAEILSSLKPVDYVVLLNNMKSDKDYDKLIACLKPDILATTENDPDKKHKQRQADIMGASVKEVIKRFEDKSTTILQETILKNK